MEKILIDNSNALMSDILNKCLLSDNCNTVRIATGYWDLLGTEMLKDSLEYFLSKNDAKLKLLIGKDPYIYYQMLSENSHLRKARYPDDFINLDLMKISKESTSANVIFPFKKFVNVYCRRMDLILKIPCLSLISLIVSSDKL